MLRRIEHASRNTAGASLCVDLLGCVLQGGVPQSTGSVAIFQKDGVTQSRGFVKLGQVPWSSSRRFQKNGVTKSRGFVKHVYIHFGYSYHYCVIVFGRVLLTPW